MRAKTLEIGKCYVCRKHVENNTLELIKQNDHSYYVCIECRKDANERKSG